MPNYVKNEVTVDSRFEEIAEFVKSEISESGFDFKKIIPMPKDLEDTQSPALILEGEEYLKALKDFENKKQFASKPITKEMSEMYVKNYGFNNWYDWSIENWGTKWNASEPIIENEVIEFQTAWATPEPIMLALSRKFPDVTFSVKYADEDIGSNCGWYEVKNGEITARDYEDRVFAMNLWGYSEEDMKEFEE